MTSSPSPPNAATASPLDIPAPERITGTATSADQRWEHIARLLHDDDLATTDRVAGCFLLLFGQAQSRIAVMTTEQITHRDTEVFVRFGQHDVPVPEPGNADEVTTACSQTAPTTHQRPADDDHRQAA